MVASVALPIPPINDGDILTAQRAPSEIAQSETGKFFTPTAKLHSLRLSWIHYMFLLGINNPDKLSLPSLMSSFSPFSIFHLLRDDLSVLVATAEQVSPGPLQPSPS